MKKAIVGVEDKRFYQHHGIDPEGMARALVNNLTDDGGTQGASTITQQYVRNMLLEKGQQEGDPDQVVAATEKTKERKLREAKYAMALETEMSKDQILTGYLNIAPFGPTTYGVEAASRLYFSKSANDLTMSEAILLAGLVQSPVEYDPLSHPEAAQDRRDTVAGVLLGVGSVAWGALTTMVIIPALNPDGRFFYTPGGEGVSGVGTQLVPALLFPAFAVWTTLLLVASMNPLVVRSWLFLPALSSILFRAILPNWRYWVPWYHYSLLPMVFIAFAAVELWRGEPTWVPKLRKALCVLAAIAGPVTITLALTVPNRVDAANRVIDEVPAGARVAAPSDLVPHLVDHTVTSLVRPPKLVDGNFKPLPDLQWVIIDERTRTFGGSDWVAQFQRTQLGDFHPVLADEGYVLYRRR